MDHGPRARTEWIREKVDPAHGLLQPETPRRGFVLEIDHQHLAPIEAYNGVVAPLPRHPPHAAERLGVGCCLADRDAIDIFGGAPEKVHMPMGRAAMQRVI